MWRVLRVTERVWWCGAVVLALAGGFIGGWFSVGMQQSDTFTSVREGSAGYRFINPLLFVETPESNSLPQLSSIKQHLERVTEKVKGQGSVTDVSVYFRNLNVSQWVAINPEERFAPASMLKVATLIAVLRAAESDSSLLERRVYIAGDESDIQKKQIEYVPQNPVVVGNLYTVEELLTQLIVDSDNIANHALYNVVGEYAVQKVYADFQLPLTDTDQANGYTTRDYSHLFRALYNGTYLSRPLSERVLSLLSKTTFKDGIVAGVPEGVIVSHKFGISILAPKSTDNQSGWELHDCGIVYYPEHPYFLCVMTRGSELSGLEQAIQTISTETWDAVKKLHRK